METLRRTITPLIRVIDEREGTVEYVASDESLDSYREVILAKGWKFDHFAKNAPFVDSHRYDGIEDLIGRVVDFRVSKGRLLETVKWAIDVPENILAQRGFAMTAAGYLKAVSVGFWPEKMVSRWDRDPADYRSQLEKMGMDEEDEDAPNTVYLQQQQIELSAVIIGANPNALARAKKAGLLSDADLEMLANKRTPVPAVEPNGPGPVRPHPRQAARLAFLLRIREIAQRL